MAKEPTTIEVEREDLRMMERALARYAQEWQFTMENESLYRTEEHVREMRRFVRDIEDLRKRLDRALEPRERRWFGLRPKRENRRLRERGAENRAVDIAAD
ncbi:hypothetical protein [Thioalkalivibrio sp. ALE19]|uniref:hypothetical protein n=1 Tax=Thioalkalivibrio sp. ALE19 TaxID=1266909 RepID=UPI0003FA0187|nr:hypothetical protein [Thioalkalivibrio sp. ALE19]